MTLTADPGFVFQQRGHQATGEIKYLDSHVGIPFQTVDDASRISSRWGERIGSGVGAHVVQGTAGFDVAAGVHRLGLD